MHAVLVCFVLYFILGFQQPRHRDIFVQNRSNNNMPFWITSWSGKAFQITGNRMYESLFMLTTTNRKLCITGHFLGESTDELWMHSQKSWRIMIMHINIKRRCGYHTLHYYSWPGFIPGSWTLVGQSRWCGSSSGHINHSTHRDRNKMAAILQTIFSHFLVWKRLHFDSSFAEIFSRWPN